MKLAILGSTGAVGRHLVKQALDAGHTVTAFARNPADLTLTHPSLRIVQGDATVAVDVARAVEGQDVVLSALGSRTRARNTTRTDTMRNLLAARPKRLVWLCAAGVGDSLAQAKRSSFLYGYVLIPLMLRHVFADAAVADDMLRRSSGIDWVVVRPVGLTDAPGTGRIEVIPDHEKVPSSWIPREDVARFMLEQATTNTHLKTMPVICQPRRSTAV
jgi:putative NADH-flavin reductase